MTSDTIVAEATPRGFGGVAIVRLSGELSYKIAQILSAKSPTPRYAHYTHFYDSNGSTIDSGLLLYFNAPNSFTGEDVIELHCHGGPFVVDRLLQACIKQGARMAEPGEFSKRAFLNDKIDLVQAEAIQDLIHAASEAAQRGATSSLLGAFSEKINDFLTQLIALRVYVEAAIDFPEEEIDFITEGAVSSRLEVLHETLKSIYKQTKQGVLLQEGSRLAIIGAPNVGKSTLLNVLCGQNKAIVTDIPGTTRDVIEQTIQLKGLPIHLLDTAGLRETDDVVEKEGIRRSWEIVKTADVVLYLFDIENTTSETIKKSIIDIQECVQPNTPIICVLNKLDLASAEKLVKSKTDFDDRVKMVQVSAKNKQGIDSLIDSICESVGYSVLTEGVFIARRRHIVALDECNIAVEQALSVLESHKAGELVAEELRVAQESLSQITGAFLADDLLGEIFSSFCIGK